MVDGQPLSAAELLQVWEWGRHEPPARRALALVAAAFPGHTHDDLAQLSIGRRDALLLAARERIFGTRLALTGRCPRCGERLELDLSVAELLAAAPTGAEDRLLEARWGDWRVTFRLPDSADLLAASASRSDPRRELLARCLLDASEGGAPRATADAPDELVERAQAAMLAADPLAEIRLDMACPACGHEWTPLFDPLAYFWEEIGNWAGGILQEVHLLARAYGWREADILALSPSRRRAYLQLVLG
jgi:hypothetical protein